MKRQGRMALAIALILAGCGKPVSKEEAAIAAEPAVPPTAAAAAPVDLTAMPTVEPPAPGTPGGLPDDRTPVSEARLTPQSAQGAANVLQTYFALLTEKKYDQAFALWGDGGKASGMDSQAFADSFAKYHQFNAQVGGPGAIEGAAGSLYVEVPVVIYGRLKTGEEVHMNGPVTLRRVNDVPGSTPEQHAWHISESGLKPSP